MSENQTFSLKKNMTYQNNQKKKIFSILKSRLTVFIFPFLIIVISRFAVPILDKFMRKNNEDINLKDPTIFLRFLSEPPSVVRIEPTEDIINNIPAANGRGSMFWLTGIFSKDYPFACLCNPDEVEKFKKTKPVILGNMSPIPCVSSMLDPLTRNPPKCDASYIVFDDV